MTAMITAKYRPRDSGITDTKNWAMAFDMPASSGPFKMPMSTPAPRTIMTTLIISGARELMTFLWIFWSG